jgi:hypothetical protein
MPARALAGCFGLRCLPRAMFFRLLIADGSAGTACRALPR